MAKKYSAKFYKSKSWRKCRESYLISKHYLCERCNEVAKVVHHKKYITKTNIYNPEVTLAFDNLEALCQDCHNKEHHINKEKFKYKFDDEGNIIPPYQR